MSAAVIASYFDRSSRCASCHRKFTLFLKRRKCAECCKFYSDQIFCKQCSTHVKVGRFRRRGYCYDCFHKLSALPFSGGLISDEDSGSPSVFSSRVKELEDSRSKEVHSLTNVRLTTPEAFPTIEGRSTPQVHIHRQDPRNLYNIGESIGSGKAGQVFKAVHIASGKPVALKQVIAEDEQETNKVEEEVNLLQSSNHSNVLQHLATYQYKNEYWIITELLEGNLKKLIRDVGGSFPEPQIAFICHEVLAALQHVHSQHRIHRDLKSLNVLFDLRGNLKLGDFGLAAQLTQERRDRITLVGTGSWMAPELVEGTHYDSGVDVWSFGILALELADGQVPHADAKGFQLFEKISSEPAPTLRHPNQWSTEFNDFLSRALQKDLGQRASVEELLEHTFIKGNVDTNSKTEYIEFLQLHYHPAD